jgi:hypothetical protein
MTARLKAVAKGLATFVLPASACNRRTGRSDEAAYCYSVFLRHLVKAARGNGMPFPRVIAELGPGDSIGIGLAGLIAGAERYFGLDVRAYACGERNLGVFDGLVELFRARTAIPCGATMLKVKPRLDDWTFPHDLLPEEHLAAALSPDRIARLRAALVQGSGEAVEYSAPWWQAENIRYSSIDWVFSQAVMEHVDDLPGTYGACAAWLRPGGWMTHQIDFKSHGIDPLWNGHLAHSPLLWRMIRGARPFLLNRQPVSAHVGEIRRAGFELLAHETVRQEGGLERARMAPQLSPLFDDDDIRTANAFLVARKP